MGYNNLGDLGGAYPYDHDGNDQEQPCLVPPTHHKKPNKPKKIWMEMETDLQRSHGPKFGSGNPRLPPTRRFKQHTPCRQNGTDRNSDNAIDLRNCFYQSSVFGNSDPFEGDESIIFD